MERNVERLKPENPFWRREGKEKWDRKGGGISFSTFRFPLFSFFLSRTIQPFGQFTHPRIVHSPTFLVDGSFCSATNRSQSGCLCEALLKDPVLDWVSFRFFGLPVCPDKGSNAKGAKWNPVTRGQFHRGGKCYSNYREKKWYTTEIFFFQQWQGSGGSIRKYVTRPSPRFGRDIFFRSRKKYPY